MLILGAKGFAKEVLEVLFQAGDPAQPVAFYDDFTPDIPAVLYQRFAVLRTPQQAQQWLAAGADFVLGVGGPAVRRLLTQKMRLLGGVLASAVAPRACVGQFGTAVGAGCTIMSGAVLTADVTLGEGVLVNLNCTIGHDVVVGDYCELSPGVHLSGHVRLGENCVLGTGAVVLPGVAIGANTVVGAGSVVTKCLEANVVAVGIPAKPIRSLALAARP